MQESARSDTHTAGVLTQQGLRSSRARHENEEEREGGGVDRGEV